MSAKCICRQFTVHFALVVLVACGASGLDRELISAAAAGDKSAVEVLLSKGADVEAQAFDDRATPLTSGVKNGHMEVVEALVLHGANLNHRDGGGTPAFWAAHIGRPDILSFIVSHGGRLDLSGEAERYLRAQVLLKKDPQLQSLFEQLVLRERADK